MSILSAADAWLTRERVRNYSLMLVAGYVLALVGLVLSLRHGLDPFGKPLGADFIIFYSASVLALKGKAALAFTPSALLQVQHTLAAPTRGMFLWCYPPTFQMLIAPLALAPYRIALLLWTAITGGLYLAMTRLISCERIGLLVALAFPAVFLNLAQGQNGFLTTALMGGGLLLLDRRPWLAGALLGLLVYKPHFGLLLPVLLLATGRWRSIAGATISACLFIAAATALFGVETWWGFFAILPVVSHNLTTGALPLDKVPSLFAALRLLGVPQTPALGASLAFAVPFVVLTVIAWRRKGPLALKAGLAVLATLLLSPYLFDYDLVLLAIPIGALAAYGQGTSLPLGGRATLVLVFAAPLVLESVAYALHLQLTPVILALCFWAVWRAFEQTRATPLGDAQAILPQPV
ncbi:glycosyltransferase family 87 protein [Caulobacter sp. S45]|uniref:glycosyltransferase family 87 protein n=1 Tax=Caulobacter sp. S45 TaxID=1641861 RepID=UPI00131DBEB2|nr:glycosyltransferase family 87 protein [Caulobacter sp. S45]